LALRAPVTLAAVWLGGFGHVEPLL